MPEISRFFGIVIGMFPDDHPPPHFHVRYGEYEAVVRIRDLALAEGRLPPRALGLVLEWTARHQAELLENWTGIEAGRAPRKIEPLE